MLFKLHELWADFMLMCVICLFSQQLEEDHTSSLWKEKFLQFVDVKANGLLKLRANLSEICFCWN